MTSKTNYKHVSIIINGMAYLGLLTQLALDDWWVGGCEKRVNDR